MYSYFVSSIMSTVSDAPLESSIVWTAYQDGNVITSKMSDNDVYSRCQVFGAPTLIEALEDFLGWIGLPQETEEVPVIIDREPWKLRAQ